MSRDPLLAEDRAARLAAQTVFERPLVVEAGAGTGKTGVLVARVVVWCLGEGWERIAARHAEREVSAETLAGEVLERVVAITFTEAAAAEMAGRVGSALAAIASFRLPEAVLEEALPEDPDARVHRARLLLAALDRLRVSTIHAFCRRILAEQPLAAGLHPVLDVDADEAVLEETVQRVVDEELAVAYRKGDADTLALAAAGHGPQHLAAALQTLARQFVPAAALEIDPFAGDDLESALAPLREACRGLLAVVGDSFTDAKQVVNAQKLVAAADELAALLDSAGSPLLDHIQERLAELFPDNLLTHLGKWAKGEPGKVEAARLGAAAQALPGPAGELREAARFLASLDPVLFGHARRVLGPLLARVQESMRRRGAIPFSGLLAEAARLLVASPEARGRLRRGIDQLLVDEFQDTDPLQCDIVRMIILDDGAEDRPGLFLVGDPKQSIYGWRNADLRAWDEFLRLIEAAGGECRFLHVNYRSVPPILDEVERCVADVMIPVAGVQPPFRPLVPCDERRGLPGFTTGDRRPAEHWIVDGATDEDEEDAGVLELEAAAVARDIRALHDAHGVDWHTVSVLLRTTTALDVVLRAFQDAGVPYAVERDRAYFQRREVIEAAALVRTVLDPADHLALLTVLRSPLVGVPDAALVPLWRHHLPDAVTELAEPDEERFTALDAAVAAAAAETPTDVPGIERLAGWPAALGAFGRTLAELRSAFDSEPADRFVERLRATTLIEACEAARRLGAFRLANLDRLLRRLAETLVGGGDAQAVLRVLRRGVAEARDAEEARPLEAAEDAVRVMTIHRAKGLTFDHVYLLQTGRRSRSGGPLLNAAEPAAGGWGLRLLGAPNPVWAEVSAHRRRVERAERVRTLYVALTRARERVVVSGRTVADEPVPLARATTHDHLLGHRRDVPADLAGRLDRGRDFIDGLGARWIRPSAPAEAVHREPGADVAQVDPAQLRRDADLLRAAAVDAAARMARPWRGAASEEAHRLLSPPTEGADEAVTGVARDLASAVGTAVHAALERLAEPFDEGALAAAATAPRSVLVAEFGEAVAVTAVDRFDELLKRLVAGPLWPRLQQVLGAEVARELPVLLPPDDGDGPVGYVAGIVDLLYREPSTGELTVLDYKTDAVEPGPDLDERVAAYASQGRAYVRAIAEALGLSDPPRFELWFLRSGVVAVPELEH